jgi:hypothetical protein
MQIYLEHVQVFDAIQAGLEDFEFAEFDTIHVGGENGANRNL